MRTLMAGAVATAIVAGFPAAAHAMTAANAPTRSPPATVPAKAAAPGLPEGKAAQARPRVVAGQVEELVLAEGRIKVNGITFRFAPDAVPIVDKSGASSKPRLEVGDRVKLTLSGSTSEPHVEEIWFLGK